MTAGGLVMGTGMATGTVATVQVMTVVAMLATGMEGATAGTHAAGTTAVAMVGATTAATVAPAMAGEHGVVGRAFQRVGGGGGAVCTWKSCS